MVPRGAGMTEKIQVNTFVKLLLAEGWVLDKHIFIVDLVFIIGTFWFSYYDE